MSERKEDSGKAGKKWSFLEAGIKYDVLRETEELVKKYRFKERLEKDQLEIFRNYFASYRVLGNQENSDMLDAEKNVEFEALEKFRLTKPLVKFMNSAVEAVRQSSADFRKEGDRLGEEYLQARGSGVSIQPNKLLRVANMLNAHIMTVKDFKRRDEVINNYVNRELPLRDSSV